MKLSKKTVVILVIITLLLVVGFAIFIGFVSTRVKVYEGENDYEIVIFDNRKIFFVRDDRLELSLDTDAFLEDVHYGYVDCPISAQDEDLDCESTTDFFEIYLKDKGNVLLVDNKGNILDIDKDSACRDRGSDDFEFYCNYWYVNYKIGDSKNFYYIQETYDSEGSSWYKILHKNKKGIYSELSDVEGFYVGDDGLLEYTEKQFSFYDGDELKYKSKKFDKIYDIYETKYVLLEDDDEIKVLNKKGKKVMNIPIDSNIENAEFKIDNNIVKVSITTYNSDIHEYEEKTFII